MFSPLLTRRSVLSNSRAPSGRLCVGNWDFKNPIKKDKLEWQVRDAKQLCRRKHMFGRGCTSASARLQQGPRQPSPEHNHRPTVEAAKIRPTFRPRDAVNDHGGRFLSLLVSVSVPGPLAPITACLWLSRASLLCLSVFFSSRQHLFISQTLSPPCDASFDFISSWLFYGNQSPWSKLQGSVSFLEQAEESSSVFQTGSPQGAEENKN